MFSKAFLQDAAERALKSAAQAAVVVLTGNAVDLWTLNYKSLASAVVLAFVVSALTSIASAGVGSKDSASLVN